MLNNSKKCANLNIVINNLCMTVNTNLIRNDGLKTHQFLKPEFYKQFQINDDK